MSGSGTSSGGWVVVTGAASGIGLAVARRLGREGRRIVLLDRDAAALRAAATEFDPAGVRPLTADVRSFEMVESVSRTLEGVAADSSEPIAGLVACAGVGGWDTIESASPQTWRDIVETNLVGAFHSARAILPALACRGAGTMVFVASDSAEFAFPRRSAYCASKAGLVAFCNVLREEVRPQGLRVTVCYMNRVDSHFNGNVPGRRADCLHPDQVADAIAFALSCPGDVEVRELKIATTRSKYGPYL